MENLNENKEEGVVQEENINPTPKKDTIEVPISQLELIIKQNEILTNKIEELEASRGKENETIEVLKARVSELSNDVSPVLLTEGVETHTLRLRVINNKPVIGFVNKATMPGKTKFVFQEVDPVIPTKINDYIEVIVHGEEKPVKMLYSEEFMASDDVITCEILETIKEKQEIKQGIVDKVDYEDWSSKLPGYKVPIKVITETIKHKVKLPSGEVITVEERVVNPN